MSESEPKATLLKYRLSVALHIDWGLFTHSEMVGQNQTSQDCVACMKKSFRNKYHHVSIVYMVIFIAFMMIIVVI